MASRRTRAQTIVTAARLGAWLGPWAQARSPRAIARGQAAVGDTRAYLYTPQGRAVGIYLVLPGLHFLGPDDPRLDRFCRILAAAGFWVVAPFVRSYQRLLLDPSAFTDARAALAFALALADRERLGRPAVFSVSFGSLLALDLAASSTPPASVLVFGGYAEFMPTVRFAITGKTEFEQATHELERDPLNSPVVFLNVLRHLEVEGDRELLAQAWLAMVHRTWGKMHLKQPGARDAIAAEIGASLPAELEHAFRMGCCLEPGFLPWLEAALERGARDLGFLDPSPSFARVSCPIVLVHGRDDDVIPFVESIKLARALPASAVRGLHLTGLYGHTGASSPGAGAVARETATMLRMLRDLARA